jgi:hypothetical protein
MGKIYGLNGTIISTLGTESEKTCSNSQDRPEAGREIQGDLKDEKERWRKR